MCNSQLCIVWHIKHIQKCITNLKKKHILIHGSSCVFCYLHLSFELKGLCDLHLWICDALIWLWLMAVKDVCVRQLWSIVSLAAHPPALESWWSFWHQSDNLASPYGRVIWDSGNVKNQTRRLDVWDSVYEEGPLRQAPRLSIRMIILTLPSDYYLVMTSIVFVLTIQIERRRCCQGPLVFPWTGHTSPRSRFKLCTKTFCQQVSQMFLAILSSVQNKGNLCFIW